MEGGKEDILHHLPLWKSLTSDPCLLEQVEGVEVEFRDDPGITKDRKAFRSDHEATLTEQEIETLTKKGVIRKIDHSPGEVVSNIFCLGENKDGTQRAISNLKSLSKNIEKIHFRMDSLKNAVALMKHGCHFASIDWKDLVIPAVGSCGRRN